MDEREDGRKEDEFAVIGAVKTSDSNALDRRRFPMKKHVECHGRDSVRNTMLKHEDIFRQQVRELHRLYQVQKMLMTELVSKEAELHSLPSAEATAAVADHTKTRIWSNASTSEITQSSRISNVNQPAACSTRAGGFLSRELSFCSRDRSNAHAMGFELDQPAEDNNFRGDGNTKQLQETWSGDGAEIDLTLSIVCGPRNKKDHSVSPCPNDEIGCSDPTGSDIRLRQIKQEKEEDCGDSSSGLDREMVKSPPWLLRALNLNKT